MSTAPKSNGWVTVAIALPIILFVFVLILILVLLRRRVQKRAQQLEDGAVWERGPLIMVNQTTVVHRGPRWTLPRNPTLRVPFLSWGGRPPPENPVMDAATSSIGSPKERFILIHHDRSTASTTDSHNDNPDASGSSYRIPQSPPRPDSKEASDEYESSLGHDVATAVPSLAVRIPQWPTWLPRWPSPSVSRNASSSQGHSTSAKSDDPYPQLKLQPPRVVRLEPSFLREYRPLNKHAHTESTTSLIPSDAPPGVSEPPTPSSTPPPTAAPLPPPLAHARHDSNPGPSTPPSRTPSVPSSLLAGRRPSAAPSHSSSVARFPRFDGGTDSQSSSEPLSRTSTAPSEFADAGRLPNPFASSASPWRTVLAVVGEAGSESAEGQSAVTGGVDMGVNRGQVLPVTPGSPLPRVRSQRAFRETPLYLEQPPEERPASEAAMRGHGRWPSSATGTLSSKPSQSSSAVLSSNPSYATDGSART
ncbi:uncharacterized protein B0H18DRAFT_1118291 [Fomitopsis serialis]|uniref:uncharacterized protein n=1 Tax=Fomitopsis serialis TaxID=139415 RepID=UPI002008860F|nr:uncharacterized protein B0H18DRAFT_1118291 [Neoantrodia serialis]KAH9927764.1 hypothetical protein B0H18DRAFT_1118291 [Neoantrodia serialis]